MSQYFLKCLTSFVFVALISASYADPIIIPAPPQIAAKAYLLMDAVTGEVLVEGQADMKLAPASLTKMMTAYITSEEIRKNRLKEDDLVLITEDAWNRGGEKSGSSTMFLKPRSKVPVIDLLRGVIIQSGNDASIALAQHLAGSEEAFADVMNQYAQLLGMSDTHFENATGWPVDGHVTTARDLARLAKAVIYDHPEHYAIYSEKSFKYNDIEQSNRNTLLFTDLTVDGLKTGHTDEAGYCLVSSAKREGMRLISVVLGTDSKKARAIESRKLLAYGFRYYQTHSVYKAGDQISSKKVWKGKADEVLLGLGRDVTITIPRGAKDKLEASTTVDAVIEAPIKEGQVLGELVLNLQGEEIFKTDLVALQAIERAGFFARIWDSIVMFFSSLFK